MILDALGGDVCISASFKLTLEDGG